MTRLVEYSIVLFHFVAYSSYAYDITDANGLGRRFDGIGGLSGGGATSKLLVNYIEPQRTQILDYLFKPNFGASLQVLKVEIGGDDQSTDGTEASHMHEEWDQNYNRGYEWWLMEEAKKRNPDIKLWGLSWAWPYWLGSPTDLGSPYNNITKTAIYTTNWVSGAKQYHNLTIDYIGIWNENYCDFDYLLTLRKTLDNAGLTSTQIVACDTTFGDFDRMYKNKTVYDAVYAFGVHYPGTVATTEAINSNKTLWASEDYSTYNDDVGAGCWARILNQNYVNGYMTSTISWNLIASYYYGLPYQEDGLMNAVQPFSGYYEVKNPIWVSAHTTQFTEIGWTYLQHGSGVGLLDNGGSYVTLTNSDLSQLTLVIETMSHDHSICIRPSLPPYNVSTQTAVFNFAGSFSNISSLHVWVTSLNFDGTPSVGFKYYGALDVVGGSVALDLGIDRLYTLTTSDQGVHGDFGDIPKSSSFPLPYFDNFQQYTLSQEPDYLAPQVGSWEVVKDYMGVQIARQTVLYGPVHWCNQNYLPMAVIGDESWTDINVTARMRIPSINGTDSLFVAAQVQTDGCAFYYSTGLFFWVNKTSSTFRLNTQIVGKTVFNGTVQIEPDTWYSISLYVKNGLTVLGTLNGNTIFSGDLPTAFTQPGFAAIGSGSYGYSDISYLNIQPTSL